MEGQAVEAPPRHGQRSDMEVNKLFESFKGSASNTLYLHLQRVEAPQMMMPWKNDWALVRFASDRQLSAEHDVRPQKR